MRSVPTLGVILAIAANTTCLAAPRPVVLKAVVTVGDPVAAETAWRQLDYAQDVTRQTLRYGNGVELTESPGDISRKLGQHGKAGQVGSVLWPMQGPPEETGATLCWRDLGDGQHHAWAREFYCYADHDKDGRFDAGYEITELATPYTRLFSRDQVIPRSIKPFGYKVLSTPGAADEALSFRYMGPERGLIVGEHLSEGLIVFSLVAVSKDAEAAEVGTFKVRVHEGRAEFRAPTGYVVQVDRVAADGRITLRVSTGSPAGPLELFAGS